MRRLRNGAGEAIEVATNADGPLTGAWCADTWRLGMGQSEGDRSVLGTALTQHTDGDAAVVVTAAGSASDELWLRLCRLGYLPPVPTAELPQALRQLSHARAFAITPKGIDGSRLPALKTAWGTSTAMGASPERIGELADALRAHAAAYAPDRFTTRWEPGP